MRRRDLRLGWNQWKELYARRRAQAKQGKYLESMASLRRRPPCEDAFVAWTWAWLDSQNTERDGSEHGALSAPSEPCEPCEPCAGGAPPAAGHASSAPSTAVEDTTHSPIKGSPEEALLLPARKQLLRGHEPPARLNSAPIVGTRQIAKGVPTRAFSPPRSPPGGRPTRPVGFGFHMQRRALEKAQRGGWAGDLEHEAKHAPWLAPFALAGARLHEQGPPPPRVVGHVQAATSNVG
jgi:hypothetical protein